MMDPTVYKIKELDLELIRPTSADFQDPESYGSKIIVIGKPGCFKPGTKVLMYNCTLKNVEDVKVGDRIMGDDSTVRIVLELCHNIDEMYEIYQDLGETYTVNKQHKLVLASDLKKTDLTEITVEEYLNKSQTFKDKMKVFKTNIELQEKKVSLDPFLLGLWLCGAKTDSSIPDEHLSYYNLKDNKHIPDDFLLNSKENRLQLLGGLLNISPNIIFNNSDYYFNNSDIKLVEKVLFLTKSLGFSTKIQSKTSFKITF